MPIFPDRIFCMTIILTYYQHMFNHFHVMSSAPIATTEPLIQDDIHPGGAPKTHDGRVEEKHFAEGRGYLGVDGSPLYTELPREDPQTKTKGRKA